MILFNKKKCANFSISTINIENLLRVKYVGVVVANNEDQIN